MIELGQILIPTDFSDYSRQASEYACELAKRFDAQIHVLHVIQPLVAAMPSPGAPIPESLLADAERAAEEQLQQWLATEFEQVSQVTRATMRGTPFVEIVRYSKDHEIDLIVIGTHGRSGLTHALIGSVAERVVRKAPCPVLSVRPQGHQFVMP